MGAIVFFPGKTASIYSGKYKVNEYQADGKYYGMFHGFSFLIILYTLKYNEQHELFLYGN
jgi:hypothetical protein